MNAPVFQYNQQQAVDGSAGGGQYITESCVVRGFIEQAKWVTARSGSLGLELTFESETGQKANYLTIYYQKADGSVNSVGRDQIQALMGVTQAQQLTQAQKGSDMIAPELTNKPVQLALERENRIKSDGNEGFGFQIKCFMSAKTGQTVAERANNGAAKSAEYWTERFKNNPHGKPAAGGNNHAPQSYSNQPPAEYDDIPGWD